MAGLLTVMLKLRLLHYGRTQTGRPLAPQNYKFKTYLDPPSELDCRKLISHATSASYFYLATPWK